MVNFLPLTLRQKIRLRRRLYLSDIIMQFA